MIICGFPGTGKSTMAKFSRWVDLESTPFEKDWMRYAKVAKHMSDNGYTVMVSTHSELLDALEQIEARYTVVIPDVKDTQIYMHRFERRGSTVDFCKKVYDNWYEWLESLINRHNVLKTLVMLPTDGCIQAWAEEMKNAVGDS